MTTIYYLVDDYVQCNQCANKEHFLSMLHELPRVFLTSRRVESSFRFSFSCFFFLVLRIGSSFVLLFVSGTTL